MKLKNMHALVEKSEKTQKEIAGDLGFSQQRFNNYMTGKREPDVDVLCGIADYFGVSVDYLLGRKNRTSSDTEGTVTRDEVEWEIIQMARELDPPQKALLLRLVKAAVEKAEKR